MNLKEEYNRAFVEDLATKLSAKASSFQPDAFIKAIFNNNWNSKELKERMRCVTENIHGHLPVIYPKQIEALSSVVHHYNGLTGMVFPDFVQVYGLDDFRTSIKAMELFTQHSTAEFAIRPFIELFPKETMQQLLDWIK